MTHPIVPCLWFDNNAEEAVNYYTSVFEDARIENISRYGEAGPGEPGSVLTVTFRLNGQEFMALNGGPVFKFNQAISFVVYCDTQAEVDYYWQKLTAGGREEQCGWLVDRYGVSWQIVPTVLAELMSSGDGEQVRRVTEALLKMVKLDIAALKAAYAQS
jgi:predicted 3-demethylubiquinone-9 3-methyltransferase (glyoxalase superfamily)